MSYATKNYTEQGGAVTHIGGGLVFESGATVTGLPAAALPGATPAANGAVKQAANVPEAAGAAPTAAEFKALLDALIASGAMAAAT